MGLLFQTSRGVKMRVWFCGPMCVFWGGVKHAKMGAATTAKALRTVFRGSIEVVK
jgi:hypothetical protein